MKWLLLIIFVAASLASAAFQLSVEGEVIALDTASVTLRLKETFAKIPRQAFPETLKVGQRISVTLDKKLLDKTSFQNQGR